MWGDYNIDLLKVNSTQFNDDYFHNILSAGYIPKVTLPTRLSESSMLIDNVFTTNLNSIFIGYSHNLLFCLPMMTYHPQDRNILQ